MSKMIEWTVDSSGILKLCPVPFKVVYKKYEKEMDNEWGSEKNRQTTSNY